jgi:DNA-directed RNA polymerase sigma subunit (sigma70/sigma32)
MVKLLADNINIFLPHDFQFDDNEVSEILEVLESAGMRLVDDFNEAVPFEPEEGWEAYFLEQEKQDNARDFLIPTDAPFRSSRKIAQAFLDGATFEEIAKVHNITRERVRQVVAKYRKDYKNET